MLPNSDLKKQTAYCRASMACLKSLICGCALEVSLLLLESSLLACVVHEPVWLPGRAVGCFRTVTPEPSYASTWEQTTTPTTVSDSLSGTCEFTFFTGSQAGGANAHF